MDWAGIGKKIIAAGAPAIGRALAGPVGGMAGELLAKVLGAEPTPEAVAEKIATAAPDQLNAAVTEANAQWEMIARMAEAEAEAQARAAEVNAREVNETIRTTAQGDGLLGKWRGVHAWELTAECFLGFFLFWAVMVFSPSSFDRLIAAMPLISIYLPARFGVLGVHVWQGSHERQKAMAALPSMLGR